MTVMLFDVETDGFDYTKIHCIAAATAPKGPVELFCDIEEFEHYVDIVKPDYFVAHNGCHFDWHVINDLTFVNMPRERFYDTSVLSKLKDFNKFSTHSLKELGEHYGVHKGEYDGPWDVYTHDMGAYCQQDVRCMFPIWRDLKHMVTDYPDAVRLEHDMAFMCKEIQDNGFTFNKNKAERLLAKVTDEMSELEKGMQREWPPELVEDRRIQYRMNKDGTPNATMAKAMASAPKWEVVRGEVVLYKWREFNPGSPQQRIDKLWDAGWEPYDRTLGHIKFNRRSRY